MKILTKSLIRACATVLLAVTTLPINPTSATNTGVIGDTIWKDSNGNGIQDVGEPGLPGVVMQLLDCNQSVMASATSDANGKYQFTALPSMCYLIRVEKPTGFNISPQNQGSDDGKDSDVNSQGLTSPVNLGVGQIDNSQDIGLVEQALPPKAAISDFVFNDGNGNGVQDAGELGIPSVVVALQDCTGRTLTSTTTNTSGLYLFSPLAAGCYVVVFTPPTGFVISPQDQGGDDTRDSDPNPTTGKTGPINLGQAESNPNIDAGMRPTTTQLSAIGDRVFNDQNRNGIKDGTEPGVGGVPVTLQDCSGNQRGSMTTNSAGYYGFSNLQPGCYVVVFSAPSGFVITTRDQGTNDTIDSDPDPSNGRTGQVNLAPGETNLTVDAGIYQPTQVTGSLGDRLFDDTNRNGVQDAGEVGIAGQPVTLQDCSGNTLRSTTTNSSGNYSFTGLAAGCYVVAFSAPSGTVFSPKDQGGNDGTDSDVNPSTGRTDPINLAAGENNTTVDAGVNTPTPAAGSLGDLVFNDLNRNGVQDSGEPGVPGVPVALQDCNGNTVRNIVTDNNGNYNFTNLASGCYVVGFSPPSGTVFSPPDQGGNDSTDSDVNPATGRTGQVNLAPGESNTTVDAGVTTPAPAPGSISDFVWNDSNANGIQDPNEPGIDGINVALFSCTGTRLATAVTANGGRYQFNNLTASCYRVRFVDIPDTFAASPADQGGNDSTDSDAISFFSVTPGVFTGETGDINLAVGQNNTTVDQGLYRPAQLGDKVFRDDNGNGVQDPSEPGVADQPVTLQTCSGTVVRSVQTDSNGNYNFSNLIPGCYVVVFTAPSGTVFSPRDQGGNDATDSDPDSATGRTGPINLVAGQNNTSVDAGVMQPLTCGLQVNKTCQVPAPPPNTNFVCSNAKPISELSVIWNGTQAINVRTDIGAVFGNIQPGDRVTAATNGRNDQVWTLTTASGASLGQSTFHVSCSDVDMTGPDDCGKAAGDGKGLTGYINTWKFDGMAGNGQRLVCSSTPVEFTDACEVTLAAPGPICEGKTKPTSIAFRYTGGSCSATTNPQGDKATCSGSVSANQAVTVQASNKKGDKVYAVSPTTVQPGGIFIVTGPFDADSLFKISNAGGTQSIGIHTSCSQPLNVGDVFGGITVVGKDGQVSSLAVTYQYVVSNTGSGLTNVSLIDDKLGTITSPFSLQPGELRSFTKTANIDQTTTNRADVSGALASGQMCSANDSVTVSVR